MNTSKFGRIFLCISFFFIFSLVSGCVSHDPVDISVNKEKTLRLTILHTNDHHGRFWKNRNGEYGMAARKTLVDQIREEVKAQGGYVLLLDAGDINSGIPESSMLKAEPDIRGMNLLGYDAMAVGNHEFDNPFPVLKMQQSWSDFPFLSANIYKKAGGQRLFTPYQEFSFKGVNITVFGLITEDTAKQANPEYTKELVFENAIVTASKMVPKLRQKTDILIGMTHMGYYANGIHGPHAPGSVSLARSVNGIDVIVDGHTHEKLDQPDIQNNTLIVQAGDYGKYLGRMDLLFEKGKLSLQKYSLIPVNLKKNKKTETGTVYEFIGQEIPEDKQVLEILSKYQKSGQEKLKEIIGHSLDDFTGDRGYIRNNETSLGNLICKAAMEKTSADLAVFNSGGIRAGLLSGNITYKDVLKIQPFGNTLCTVTLTGGELKGYLEKVVNMPKDTGGYAQLSGFTAQVSDKKIKKLSIGQTPISAEKMYRLVVPSYLAAGGDGYPELSNHPGFIDTGYVDADVLKEYIVETSPLSKAAFPLENNIK